MHVTKVSVTDAPTQVWPTNLTELLTLAGDISDDEIETKYSDYITPLVAASSGAVSILPDYIGYGVSPETHKRNFAYPPTHTQTAVRNDLDDNETGHHTRYI
jgi:hypothetical protein